MPWGRRAGDGADGGACLPHVIEDTRQWIGLDLKPLNAWITPPPTQLPARVAPIRARHREWKLFESQFTAYSCERFGVSDAGQDQGRRRDTCVERGLRLRHEPPFHLKAAPLVEAAIDRGQARRQPDSQRLPRGCCSRAQASQRRSGRLEDLDRADHAHRIVEVDPWVGVRRKEPLPKALDAKRLEIGA